MHCLNRICPTFTSPLHRWLTRRLSCTQIFVGGLSYDTNESVLKAAFEGYGEIIEVKVICDRVSGKSRGYGFVRYSSEVAAGKALMEMDGRKYPYTLCAKRVKAKEVREKLGKQNSFQD